MASSTVHRYAASGRGCPRRRIFPGDAEPMAERRRVAHELLVAAVWHATPPTAPPHEALRDALALARRNDVEGQFASAFPILQPEADRVAEVAALLPGEPGRGDKAPGRGRCAHGPDQGAGRTAVRILELRSCCRTRRLARGNRGTRLVGSAPESAPPRGDQSCSCIPRTGRRRTCTRG